MNYYFQEMNNTDDDCETFSSSVAIFDDVTTEDEVHDVGAVLEDTGDGNDVEICSVDEGHAMHPTTLGKLLHILSYFIA